MEDYSIIGRVIDHEHRPVSGLSVLIFHNSEITRRPHQVGETRTDVEGRFDLRLDPSEAGGLTARLGHPPQLHLVLKAPSGREILSSRSLPIDWQLEYRIYLGGGKNEAGAPDLYDGTVRRMIADAREADLGGRFKNGGGSSEPPSEKLGWLQAAAVAAPSEGPGGTIEMLFAASDGVMTEWINAPRLQVVEYDGPQVPRHAWEAPDDQVIIWPRRERFRWG